MECEIGFSVLNLVGIAFGILRIVFIYWFFGSGTAESRAEGLGGQNWFETGFLGTEFNVFSFIYACCIY